MTDTERATLETIVRAADFALREWDHLIVLAALSDIKRLAQEQLDGELVGGLLPSMARIRHPEWFDDYEAPLL